MQTLRFLSFFFAVAFVYSLLTGSSGGRATSANAGNTGAPTESTTCGNCHSGGGYGVVAPTIQVFQAGTTTPVSSYTPGTTYDMRVTVTHTSGTPGGFGFQMTCLTTPGNSPLAGYSNLATNVKQKTMTSGQWNGRTYVEHSGVTNNNIFNFKWTAPASGTGSVRFYASGNAVNATGNTGGDNAGNATFTLPEAVTAVLVVTGQVTGVSCNGGTNGGVNITPSGGTPPYSFSWSNGSSQEDLVNVAAGTYTVFITDAGVGATTATYTVTQPSVLAGLGSITSPILCAGGTGTVVITASGGTSPYTGTGTFTASAGVQTYTITDANGCTAIVPVSLTAPSALAASGSIVTPITCAGGTASVQVTASGGTPPYMGIGTFTANAGAQNYTVTDANGCTSVFSVTITSPSALVATGAIATPIACAGGSATVLVTASGGTAPYSGTGSFSANAGSQSYTVTDANGCTNTTTVNVSQPAALLITVDSIVDNTGTANGGVYITVSGGTQPYSYTWSNGSSTQDITGLTADTFNVVISDGNGCMTEAVSLIVENITSIQNPFEGQVNVYPNPFTQALYVEVQTSLLSSFSVTLYNLEGKKLLTQTFSEGNMGIQAIDMRALPQGQYLLLMQSAQKQYIMRVTKL